MVVDAKIKQISTILVQTIKRDLDLLALVAKAVSFGVVRQTSIALGAVVNGRGTDGRG